MEIHFLGVFYMGNHVICKYSFISFQTLCLFSLSFFIFLWQLEFLVLCFLGWQELTSSPYFLSQVENVQSFASKHVSRGTCVYVVHPVLVVPFSSNLLRCFIMSSFGFHQILEHSLHCLQLYYLTSFLTGTFDRYRICSL